MGKVLIKDVEKGTESLTILQLKCKASNYYEERGQLLTLVNNRPKKPFDLLKESFDGI